MNKENIRKEFNEFIDSASDETIKDFLKFIKERKARQANAKSGTQSVDPFKNRTN